ncbi:unnamed protein product [Gongylonema pulchrum]|uniref:Anillin domain-containing protein n=1 Tax=Gongylonema pulchrum TaxID=637853 RepID=A0A183DWM7_9BILA|nr:unnamed protein product [Gongylonema pulchrum]
MKGLSVRTGSDLPLYRNMERERCSALVPDMPVRFSPAAYSPPPSAGERVETYGHNYVGEHGGRLENQVRTKSHIVTTDPVATSTPVDGSPAIATRMQNSGSYLLNRSGISSITACTAQELTQSQNIEMKLQVELLCLLHFSCLFSMKEGIMVQEDQISQAMLALLHCKKNNNFNGSLVELSAQRSLLLARERLLALQNESQRLRTLQLVKKPMPPLAKRMRGAIDLTSINLYLNRNFCVRNTDENVSYAFVILLKTDDQVEATQIVSLMDTRALRVSKLSAQRSLLLARERLLALQNESQRLRTLQLVKKPMPPLAKRMRGAIDLTSINLYLNRNFCVRNTDENVSYAFVILLKTDDQVEATQIVSLMDTRALRVSKVHFNEHIRFTNLPVDFTVLMEIYALTMYQMVAGLGSWARYWAVLRRGVVQFWKYPDDEASEKVNQHSCLLKKKFISIYYEKKHMLNSN